MEKDIEQKFIDKKKLDDVRGMIESEILNLNSDILDLTKIYKQDIKKTKNEINIKSEIRNLISNFISKKISKYLNDNLTEILEPLIKQYLGSKKVNFKEDKFKETSKNAFSSEDKAKLKVMNNSPKKIILFKRKRKQSKSYPAPKLISSDELNKMTKIQLLNFATEKEIKLNQKMKKNEIILKILNDLDAD